MKTESFQAKIR